jgi:hypothetical protein
MKKAQVKAIWLQTWAFRDRAMRPAKDPLKGLFSGIRVFRGRLKRSAKGPADLQRVPWNSNLSAGFFSLFQHFFSFLHLGDATLAEKDRDAAGETILVHSPDEVHDFVDFIYLFHISLAARHQYI